MVEPGECAADAVVREVREETGIQSEVLQLVTFREAHFGEGSTWQSGKTNIFLLFLLRPTSLEIQAQEEEIEDCKWIDLAEYWPKCEQRMKPGTLYHTMLRLACDAHEGKTSGFCHQDMQLGFRPGTNKLYFPINANS